MNNALQEALAKREQQMVDANDADVDIALLSCTEFAKGGGALLDCTTSKEFDKQLNDEITVVTIKMTFDKRWCC